MMAWITANISNIIICTVLLTIVASIVACMARKRKKGKSLCGCGCKNCPMSGSCHSGK